MRLAGVALLAGRVLILLEDLVNDWQERRQLPFGPGPDLSIARRFAVLQDLRERVPVQVVLLTGSAFTELFGEYSSSDLGP